MGLVPRRVPRRAIAAGPLALLVGLLFAGCSGGPAGNGSPAPSTVVVEVAASDYGFDPSVVTVAPGPITFRVGNVGGEEHEFEILRGDAVVDEIEGLVPGLTRDVTVTLQAGDYTLVCTLADHEARGMKGTLTVAPS